MFDGSRFFYLLKVWAAEEKKVYIFILRAVMNHYFDSIAGYKNSGKLELDGDFLYEDISYVLDCVGYHNYSINNSSDSGIAFITLRNTL